MPKVEIFNADNKVVGEKELNDSIFGVDPKPHLLHTVVVAQMAERRSGSAKTKSRHEASGGGRKPWRQKGSGRARAGTIRSPLWRGGGIAFGPKPRDFSQKVNKKVRKSALRTALSLKLKEGNLVLLDEILVDEPKTKEFLRFAQAHELKSALIVDVEPSENLRFGARNLREFKVLPQKALNVLDILRFEKLVITGDAVEKIEEGLGK
ncbi:MAG: 50S ribosomal protein L4 [Deltaproteobacteria bacterium]|nr:50S ribosomal protein L4 [Deltaproteobacteria bacterium]NIS77023.1 50S ribosomal protein L4 [Deltaproteobacteria bacterium]